MHTFGTFDVLHCKYNVGSHGAFGFVQLSKYFEVASRKLEFIYTNSTWKSTFGGTIAGGNNLYNSDGALTGNRIVTQGANTLAFSGTGNTLFNNGNVGIGIALPTSKFQVNGVGTKNIDIMQ